MNLRGRRASRRARPGSARACRQRAPGVPPRPAPHPGGTCRRRSHEPERSPGHWTGRRRPEQARGHGTRAQRGRLVRRRPACAITRARREGSHRVVPARARHFPMRCTKRCVVRSHSSLLHSWSSAVAGSARCRTSPSRRSTSSRCRPSRSPPVLLPTSSGVCTFITPAEMATIWAQRADAHRTHRTSCTFTFSNFSTVNVSTDDEHDLQILQVPVRHHGQGSDHRRAACGQRGVHRPAGGARPAWHRSAAGTGHPDRQRRGDDRQARTVSRRRRAVMLAGPPVLVGRAASRNPPGSRQRAERRSGSAAITIFAAMRLDAESPRSRPRRLNRRCR